MASLDHENIVKVYDISQDGEVPFIVAECIAGKDVGGLIAARRDGRLDEAFVKDMAEQLLSALSYAHGRGIIHRDIKPSNILVTPGGTIKVADFGIARILEEDDVEEGEPGEIVGSARYMSPEQLRGEEATPRSDLYSVGILLYHCLTGRPPFSGDVRNLAKQHVHETPTPPRRLNKKISPGMEAVILKALAKNPAHRYGSAAGMLDDIEGLPGDGRAPTSAARPSPGRPETARRRWNRGRLALASALALLLLAGGGGALAAERGYLDLPALAGGGGAGSAGDTLGRATPVDTQGAPETPETAQGAGTGDAQEQAEPARQEPVQEEVAQREPVEEAVRNAGASASAAANGEEEYVPVPEVTTFYDYYARQALADNGLEAKFVYEYRPGFAPRGVTWATEPAAGTRVPVGTTVTVFATPQDRPPLL